MWTKSTSQWLSLLSNDSDTEVRCWGYLELLCWWGLLFLPGKLSELIVIWCENVIKLFIREKVWFLGHSSLIVSSIRLTSCCCCLVGLLSAVHRTVASLICWQKRMGTIWGINKKNVYAHFLCVTTLTSVQEMRVDVKRNRMGWKWEKWWRIQMKRRRKITDWERCKNVKYS